MLHMVKRLNWELGNYTQIENKIYEPGKKIKNQITTRNKRKIIFTDLIKLQTNYRVQTDQFAPKIKDGCRVEQSMKCILFSFFF